MNKVLFILTLSLLLGLSCGSFAQSPAGDDAKAAAEAPAATEEAAPAVAPEANEDVHIASDEEKAGLPNVGNKICPVSGDNVTEMGESVPVVYKGKIYNMCCEMCLKDFQKHPEKFSKIAEDEAEEDQGQKNDK